MLTSKAVAGATGADCTDAERGSSGSDLTASQKLRESGEPLEVLRNVNLTVAEQAIVGLLGASGSGKSTLLNIISGIVKPDRGQVCICGAASDELQ